MGHLFRLGKAEVDCDPRPAVFSRHQAAPADQVPACFAEVEGNGAGTASIGGEPIPRGFNLDAVAIEAIGPEYAIAAADRAIANGGVGNIALKCPMHCAAMAGPRRHRLRGLPSLA